MNEFRHLELPEGPVRFALQQLERLYMPTSMHEQAMSQLKRLMQSSTLSGRHKGLALIGPSGSGKTATVRELERWLRAELKLPAEAPSPLPIALVTAEATHKALLSSILVVFEDPLAGSGTASHMAARVKRFARERGVMGLAIDEFQHTFSGKTTAQARAVTQTVKNLVNSLELPVILVGLPSIELFIESSDELAQRFKRKVRLVDLQLRNKQDAKELVTMLRTLNAALPLAPDCSLDTPDMLSRVLLASKASFGSLVDLVKRSCEIAAFNRRDFVTMKDLSTAFRESSGASARLDPFVAPIADVQAAANRLMTSNLELAAANE